MAKKNSSSDDLPELDISSVVTTNKAKDFKTIYSLMPSKKTQNEEFEHFTNFLIAYNDFVKADDSERDAFEKKGGYHLEKLWSQVLHEFMSPMWCYGEKGYDENLAQKKQGSFNIDKLKQVLREANENGDFTSFFKAFPYIKDLLFIDKLFSDESRSEEDILQFCRIVSNYLIAIDKHDALFPILVLKEHINLMLGRDEFDREFYSKHMKGANQCLKGDKNTQLLFLSMFVNNKYNLSEKTKLSDKAFKKFDWDSLDGLYKAINEEFHKSVSNDRLTEILESIERYLEKLILFEIGEVDIDEVPVVDLNDLSKINTESNLKPAFEIIEHYLDIAAKIENNDSTSRLAILRVITAIGEAIFVIKPLIPLEKIGLLEKFVNLRDDILHSTTNESFKYLTALIHDEDNSVLNNVLIKIKGLKDFFKELQKWFTEGGYLNKFPDIPDLSDIEIFATNYAANRTKDDRDVKLSLADCSALEKPIPDENVVDNDLKDEVEGFARNLGRISRTDFVNACIGTKKLNTGEFWKNSELKKVHEKITELNKVKLTRVALNEPDFDFDKVSLNLKKSNKAKLKIIKEEQDVDALNALLDQHEIENLVNIDEFLQSIREIHLAEHKEILRKFVNEEIVSKSNFEAAVQIVFRGDDEAQLVWHEAYLKFQEKIESLKRDQLTQVEYAVESIDALKIMADKIHDDRGVDIGSDPVTAIACEMQYGLCTNNIKTVMHFIDRMYDYNDKSLYFIYLPHPIKETQEVLDLMVTARNDLFHFERTFNEDLTIESHRMVWFSILENLTHGIFFPEAIVVSPEGISREPITSESNLLKLQKYLELVHRSIEKENSDTINVYRLASSSDENDVVGSENENNAFLPDNKKIQLDDTSDLEKLISATALPTDKDTVDNCPDGFLLGCNFSDDENYD